MIQNAINQGLKEKVWEKYGINISEQFVQSTHKMTLRHVQLYGTGSNTSIIQNLESGKEQNISELDQ